MATGSHPAAPVKLSTCTVLR